MGVPGMVLGPVLGGLCAATVDSLGVVAEVEPLLPQQWSLMLASARTAKRSIPLSLWY